MNDSCIEFYGGAIQSPKDDSDKPFYMISDMATGASNIPKEYSVSWVPDIKNQERTNSCTAFALSYIIECIHHKITGERLNFSTGYLYGNRRHTAYTDVGEIMRDAIKGAQKDGDVFSELWDNNKEVPEAISEFEKDYEYLKNIACKYIKGYVRLRDIEEAKAHIVKYDLPLFISARMKNINPLTGSDGLHAMICTGYTWDKFFLCQNSWGKDNCPHPKMKFDNFEEVWGVIPMTSEKFTDVENNRWSCAAIEAAVEDGIVAGYPDGTYMPEKPLTREEMAVIWARIKAYCATHFEKNL